MQTPNSDFLTRQKNLDFTDQYEWMNEQWKEGWKDERMNEWKKWMNVWKKLTNVWKKLMNVWKKLMYEWLNKIILNECMNVW